MRTRRFAGYLTAFSTLVVLALPVAAAAAEGDGKAADADPAAKVQQLNRTGMQYFDDLNYAMAEKTLLEALAIVEKANLSGPPVLATNGNLAVLYSAGLKKPDKAVFHFKKALALKPDLKLSKQRATPETEANLARAKAEMAGGAGAGKGGEAAPAGEGDFRCPGGGEVQAGDEITLKCVTSAALQPATVMLYYKVGAAPEFEVHRTTKEAIDGGGAAWVAKIPAPRTEGTSVLFYFEANDPGGNILASSGSEVSPGTIAVKGGQAAEGAGPPPVAEAEEEEEEEEEGEEIDDNNPLAGLERERRREHEGSKGTWWVGMGVGSGLGYASGTQTEAFGARYGVRFNSGVAWAATGHLVPEIGYFVGRKTALALTGRNQGIFGGPKGTATGAHSVLLRALFFTEDDTKVRWYFATAAGFGEGFRMQVSATVRDPETLEKTGTVKDTVRGGPFVVGIGGGMQYKLGKRFRWVVESQALVGFTHVSVVLDLSTGVRLLF